MSDRHAWLHDLFAALGPIRLRPMFGCLSVYHDGLMIALAHGDDVYLKTDEETRERFAQAGCDAFVYLSKGEPMTLSYWSVPAEALEDPQTMLPWARLAQAAALRKANAPRKPARSRKRAPGRGDTTD